MMLHTFDVAFKHTASIDTRRHSNKHVYSSKKWQKGYKTDKSIKKLIKKYNISIKA